MKQTKLLNDGQQVLIVETKTTLLNVLMKTKSGHVLCSDGSGKYYATDEKEIRKALAEDSKSESPKDRFLARLIAGVFLRDQKIIKLELTNE